MKYQWRESNHQPYLYVEAEDHYTLGLGVGRGMHKQITFLHHATEKLRNSPVVPAGLLANLVEGYQKFIPEPYIQEIKGMYDGYIAETQEGLAFADVMMQAVLINLIYQAMSRMPSILSTMGCTNFGVVNPDGSVVHGQNYDADGRMTAANAFVHHKLKGEPEIFAYRTGADLTTATCKSETGVVITVSVVMCKLVPDIMMPRSVMLREALQKRTAIEAARAMTDDQGRSPFSYNLIISDQKTVVGAQAIPSEQRLVQVKKQLVQSNQYDYVDWGKHMMRPSYSKKRQLYAEEMLDKLYARYGGISDGDLIEILSDEPVICRKGLDDGIGTTILFLTRESFGLGNPKENPIGKVPF